MMSAGRPAYRRVVSLAVLGGALCCASCEILRISPFRVVSWTPGEGRFGMGEDLSVGVVFSEAPDRVSAENSFSMTEDGITVPGAFSWEGAKLSFSPYVELRRNARFRVSVSVDAMTSSGVSLEEPLEGRFTTKAEDVRPSVVSTTPSRGGMLAETSDGVSIVFSEAVDSVSYRSCLSFSPSILGVWSQSDDGATASFAPLEPWDWGAEYECSISADLKDESLNRMGEAFTFRFAIGDDDAPPEFAGADAQGEADAVVASIVPDDPTDAVVTENPGWEALWRLRLRFSEPVSMSTLDSRVEAEDGPTLTLETTDGNSSVAVFRFDERPEFGSRILVRVRSGVEDVHGNATESDIVLRLVADGAGSRPPRLVGIRLPMAPGEAIPEDRDLATFAVAAPYSTIALEDSLTRYPVNIATSTSLELYVELASGASLDALSLMSSFRISSTNGALDFSANGVATTGLVYAPPYAPWAEFAVARIDGTITNHVDSGVVTVQLASGFEDSAGNATRTAQSLPLLK